MLVAKISRAAPLRVLHFDIETRRVGFFTAGKFSPDGCEPIAIAAGWANETKVSCWTLANSSPVEMLAGFLGLYEQADILSGHYCRRFDLPVLNGALMENGLGPLAAKYVSDTKGDLRSRGGLSASQENLAEMYRLQEEKFHMNDQRWREASRLTDDGLALARRRVISDVKQHKRLRAELLERGWLKDPRAWRP